MKITDAEIIRNGERDLIDAITADLDWGAIEEVFLKEHNLSIEEDIEYKSGDIIALENQIAYKLEFEVKVNLSVILDRNGDYISVSIKGKNDNSESHQVTGAEDSEQIKDHEEVKESADHVEQDEDNDPVDSDNKTDFGDIAEEPVPSDTERDTPMEEETTGMESKVDEMLENINRSSKPA